MAWKIALAGNPNSGKTTLFNALTGSNQYVGNWPGVTVEKKEGRLKADKDVVLQDLPGVYSLSPYTQEEVVTRGYLVNEEPDAILNIIDATNIERNLYLTTQLSELGLPMVIALNMMDLIRKRGDSIDAQALGKALGCPVVEISALKGDHSEEIAEAALKAAKAKQPVQTHYGFSGRVEHALAHIEDFITHNDGLNETHHHHADGSVEMGSIVPERLTRWYAVKLFERDAKVLEELNLPEGIKNAIESVVSECESEMDDDSEAIITDQRYNFVAQLVEKCVRKAGDKDALTTSDKIDRIVTNRFLALPIFAALMFAVYYISVTTIGSIANDWITDVLVGKWIKANAVRWMQGAGVAAWLVDLIGNGIIGGVGSVLGFVPQMLVLFLFLAVLEDVGYMSRIAFIMDRIFRKFGLSGKSFIPLLIGSGCGVPGIMASRTIENVSDRRMTIITTTFIPCSAKLPMIAMISGALFGFNGLIATGAYFVGIGAVVVSGIILKKTRLFSGNVAPFIMELPAYHIPSVRNVSRSVWERISSFVKRAGTVILISSIVIWFLSGYGWQAVPTDDMPEVQASFGAVENMNDSILGHVGSLVAPAFKPLGFGNWQSTVATAMGLVAKEEVVSVFGVLYPGNGRGGVSPIAEAFDESGGGYGRWAALAFLIFNLLCAPCIAAIGAIRKEMNSAKWTFFAIGYQCGFAYVVALMVFQFGKLFSGGGFGAGTAFACLSLAFLIFMIARKESSRSAKKGEA